ncbi:hypothetical protein GCM10007036_14230 [Alsobacter metallidurans]|uniref:Phage portal protein n=1 Tax=Alsobacter metallidurans TaxID=340221 RepID=A0A917I5Y1_9HYPH|nr:phage portal protein [Alsobacter metallidurans]GGH14727.1 hypothetical protein GCM10007036_14230 [Alsobacter metallidurans]
MALMDYLKRKGPGRRRSEPQRDTFTFPNTVQLGQTGARQRVIYKPTPRNLRFFGQTVYARRAINAIKNPIKLLDWEVRPRKGIDINPELQRQIDIATACLTNPNNDDSFHTFVEQLVEDVLHGAAAYEQQLGGDPLRPLWLWPVDGLSIQIFPGWNGDINEARYQQTIGYGTAYGGGHQILLRNNELVYLRPNASTATPFGVGALEIAFNTISRTLGVGEFAGNVASNARPSVGLDLGDGVSAEGLQAFRNYWRNEIEGQGQMPIMGLAGEKGRGANVLRFYPEGDNALFLKYQEFLKSEIATAFDLSPQNLGVERDVNRSTGEVGEDRDWDGAIKPMAHMVSSHISRETIQGLLGFSQLEFGFLGIDREDEKQEADVYAVYYASNAITPNEQRERMGLPPLASPYGDMILIEANQQIAQQAADAAAETAAKELARP